MQSPFGTDVKVQCTSIMHMGHVPISKMHTQQTTPMISFTFTRARENTVFCVM